MSLDDIHKVIKEELKAHINDEMRDLIRAEMKAVIRDEVGSRHDALERNQNTSLRKPSALKNINIKFHPGLLQAFSSL